MKRTLVFIFIWFSFIAKGQLVVGNYDTNNESHSNNRHYEELILRSDSTFNYSTGMEFIKINKEGKWSLLNDTLTLNENNPYSKEKIIVEEKRNKKLTKHTIVFYVSSIQGEDINYHLIITSKDSTRTIWSRTGTTEIKIKNLNRFYFIVNSLIYSPTYDVKSPKSNEFKIRLAPILIFYNEKWLFRNGTIIPIGWDNKYSNYYLSKQ